MKTLTVRLPEELLAEIEMESRQGGISKSDVIRRRLGAAASPAMTLFDLASDVIGSVDDNEIPRDVSARRKDYLRKHGYGTGRHR
jgi:Arc/MetJ-type ribon-helix-helix transcriptional regulator